MLTSSSCFFFIRDTMENMDTDIVIIDPSKLLDTDINNIHYDLKKLLDKLQKKVQEAKKIDLKAINGKCVHFTTVY